MHNDNPHDLPRFRPTTIALLAVTLTAGAMGLAILAADLGYIVLVRSQLQTAANSTALVAASKLGHEPDDLLRVVQQQAGSFMANSQQVKVAPEDIERGIWDSATRSFIATQGPGNAVRISTRHRLPNDRFSRLLLTRFIGQPNQTLSTSAVAMTAPRDIVFVVDLSGSMNDDTEPVWATAAIDERFGSAGSIGSHLMQDLYHDLDFGIFPGPLETVGEPLGIVGDDFAYARLTADDSPLTDRMVPDWYRIEPDDTELVRKQKAYRWIIDHQLARLMPAARPTVSSKSHYSYWEKYLDYTIRSVPASARDASLATPAEQLPEQRPNFGRNRFQFVSTSSETLEPSETFEPTKPVLPEWLAGRGILPPEQDINRVEGFNNPNRQAFPTVAAEAVHKWQNRLGYVTYVNFMLDHGRDLLPDGENYSPLSRHSQLCPLHSESTPGGTFQFPPRTQPMHSARRALIAALAEVEQRNQAIPNLNQRDWVAVVSFDSLTKGGPTLEQALTGDYQAAMQACTMLQAAGDKGPASALEAGLLTARRHLSESTPEGKGRAGATKIVVLLTDGHPDLYVSAPARIDRYLTKHPSYNYYCGDRYTQNAVLVQAHLFATSGWQLYPVAVGMGANVEFLDRIARMAGTADVAPSVAAAKRPYDCEQRLRAMFQQIYNSPQVQLVQ